MLSIVSIVAFQERLDQRPGGSDTDSKQIDKAQSSIHARARAGGTALHWAVNKRNSALRALLLESGNCRSWIGGIRPMAQR